MIRPQDAINQMETQGSAQPYPTSGGAFRPRRPVQPPRAAAPMTPSGVPPVTTMAQTPAGPDPNLRPQTFLPGSDPRLQNAQGATDQAAGQALGRDYSQTRSGAESRYRSIYGTGQVTAPGVNTQARFRSVNPGESARTARYGSAQDQALESLNGADRGTIAKQRLEAFDAQNFQPVQDQQRAIIQRAASAGRLGMGDEGVNALRPFTDYLTNRAAFAKQLAADSAEGDINDRFRRLDATSGLRGQESSLDQQLYGRGANERDAELGVDERNIGRGIDERNFGVGLSERNAGRGFDYTRAAMNDAGGYAGDVQDADYRRLGAAGSLEDQIFGQGQSNRNEYRGERARQDTLAQQDIENKIKERELGNTEMNDRLRRALAQAQVGGAGAPSLDDILRQAAAGGY